MKSNKTNKSIKENKMKKINLFFLLAILLVTGLQLQSVQAQGDLTIILTQPPPNQLNIADVWSFTLTNTTDSLQEIYLKGEAIEEKDGLIAIGQTVKIKLNPNETKKMKVSDLPKTPDISYIAKDPKYKESLIRQGKFPSGKYEICVKVISAATNEELGSDCINQEVLETGLLTLINPADGEEIDTKVPITFSWSSGGNIPEGGYTLRIVEVLKNQTPETAMKGNKAWFEKKGIKTTSFSYPKSAKGFEEGKTYAWKVSSSSNESEVRSFIVGGIGVIVDSLKVDCSDKVGNYYFKIWIHNNSTSNVQINQISIASTMPGVATTLGPITFTPSGPIGVGGACLISGSFTGPSSPIISTVSFLIPISDPNDPLNQASYHPSTNVNCPNRNCCEGFLKNFQEVNIIKDSSNNINFTANIISGPLPIKKVTAEMVYFYQSWGDTNCAKCVNNNNLMGNFTGGTFGSFGSGTLNSPPFASTYSREITFTSAGQYMTTAQSINLNLALPAPSSLSCCGDTIRLCIRFSFTDTACITCDTIICRKIVRTNSNITTTSGGNKMRGDDEIVLIYEKLPHEDEFINSFNEVKHDYTNEKKNDIEGQEKREPELINIKKDVQLDPICIDFSDGLPHGWTVNTAHTFSNVGVTASIPPTGGPDGTSYLHGKDEQGQSFMYNFSDYSGDWTQFFNTSCPNFCWDFKIFDYWTSQPVHPSITISTIFDPSFDIDWQHHPAFWATFTAYTTVSDDNGVNPGWHHFCAPIETCDNNGNMPNNSYGAWTIWDGSTWTSSTTAPTPGTCADWLSLLQNVECMRIGFDYTNNPIEEIGYDQLCLGDCGENTIPQNNCCDNFDINITSTNLEKWSSIPNLYSFNANINTGPNRIKKVRALMTNFSQTYSNPDCQQCVKNPTQWGSLVGLGSIGALTGNWTNPYNTPLFEFTNWRETIWENSNGQTVPMLNNQNIDFLMMLPDKPLLSCCADTFNFCVKYEFTDSTCRTCDTTICYSFVLSGPPKGPGKIPTQQQMKLLPNELKDKIQKYQTSPRGEGEKGYDKNFNENIENEISTKKNDLEESNILEELIDKSSSVKLNLLNHSGIQIWGLIDKLLKRGKLYFNLTENKLTDHLNISRIGLDESLDVKSHIWLMAKISNYF